MIKNNSISSKIYISDIKFDKDFIEKGVFFDEKKNSSISKVIGRTLNINESIDVVAQIIGKNIKCKLSYVFNLHESQYNYQINWVNLTKTSNYLNNYKKINYCDNFKIFGITGNNKFIFESFDGVFSFSEETKLPQKTVNKKKLTIRKAIDNRIFIKNRLIEIDFLDSINHLTKKRILKKNISFLALSSDLKIWDAFKNDKFITLFRHILLSNNFSYNEASMIMTKFSEIVKDASLIETNKSLFDNCEDFKSMQNMIENLFDSKYSALHGSLVKYLFLAYLKYLKEFHFKWHNISSSIFDYIHIYKPITKSKKTKIKLTNKFGKTEIYLPQDALREVILLIGAENVLKMNIKVGNYKLIINYYHGLDKKYEQIDKWCWLYTHGSSAQKFHNIKAMLSRYKNLGIKAELIE